MRFTMCCFFFFKQKTAYEMCISDWSSDVCSSDLMTLLGEAGLRRLAAINHGRAQAAATELAKVPGVSVLNGGFFNEFTLLLPVEARPVIHRLTEKGILGGEIGRAHV